MKAKNETKEQPEGEEVNVQAKEEAKPVEKRTLKKDGNKYLLHITIHRDGELTSEKKEWYKKEQLVDIYKNVLIPNRSHLGSQITQAKKKLEKIQADVDDKDLVKLKEQLQRLDNLNQHDQLLKDIDEKQKALEEIRSQVSEVQKAIPELMRNDKK